MCLSEAWLLPIDRVVLEVLFGLADLDVHPIDIVTVGQVNATAVIFEYEISTRFAALNIVSIL